MKANSTKVDGFYNLLLIISCLCVLRFLIEDYREFGFIMNVSFVNVTIKDLFYYTMTMLVIVMRSYVSFRIMFLHHILIIINFVVAEFFILVINIKCIHNAYVSGSSLILNIVMIAKLISFHTYHKNIEVKLKTPKSKTKEKGQQTDLYTICTFKHFVYFNLLPTLCYEATYAKKATRSYYNIFIKSVSILGGLFLFTFVADQYSIPSIYRMLQYKNTWIFLENAINLSLSTAFLFLIFFNLVFVCCLNILSELTRLKGVEFYREWWNATTVGEFWTLWNIPVHLWIKKYIYIPLKKKKLSVRQAQSVCFFISALFHEYVLSVATKQFCGYVFLGMMAQIPLIVVSDYINAYCPTLANFFFWCSFCIIGQSAVVVLYYRSQEIKNFTS